MVENSHFQWPRGFLSQWYKLNITEEDVLIGDAIGNGPWTTFPVIGTV